MPAIRPAKLGSYFTASDVLRSEQDHFEIRLGDSAIGTRPVGRNVFPPGAGFDSVIRIAGCLVVGVSANYALPFFQVDSPVDRRLCGDFSERRAIVIRMALFDLSQRSEAFRRLGKRVLETLPVLLRFHGLLV